MADVIGRVFWILKIFLGDLDINLLGIWIAG